MRFNSTQNTKNVRRLFIMLMSFSVENFGSIGHMQTLNLMTGKSRGKSSHLMPVYKKKSLKFSSIYGGNASGKSTLIRAIHYGKTVIQNGYMDKRFMSVNKTNSKWIEKPSTFIYSVFINKKIYEYGFSLIWDQEKIVKEWLKEKNSRYEEQTIFIRDSLENKFEISLAKSLNDEIYNRVCIYFKDSAQEDNNLFLKEINYKKGNLFDESSLQFLRILYNWFDTKLKFVYPNNDSDLGQYNFINYPENNDKLYECLFRLDIPIDRMSYIDTTFEHAFKSTPRPIIEKIQNDIKTLYEREEMKDKAPTSFVLRLGDSYYILEAGSDGLTKIKTIVFSHNSFGNYEFSEESDGTKRILELLEIITSPEKDVTYFVDEIDRSLHPLLTEQFITMYLNPEEINFNQLIITTHESRLLNLKTLRKDEINFISNINGESHIVRLDEFEASKSRSDINLELAYLNGRYNGIPNIIKPECGNK